MEELERIYEIFQKTEDLSGLYKEYNQICVNCGRKIRVLEPGHEYTGVAEGINQDGELMVCLLYTSTLHCGAVLPTVQKIF